MDPPGNRPAYRRIADDLRGEIVAGQLTPGAKLPSERELTMRYATTNKTVREALGVLRAEGRVVPRQGVGVFVADRPPIRRRGHDRFLRRHREEGKAAHLAELAMQQREAGVDVLFVGQFPAPAEVASLLGVETAAPVLARRRRYLADGQPTELATSYLPLELVADTAIGEVDTGPGGIYARLEELGHRLDHFDEEVSARMPTPDEREALSLGPGVPVIRVLRVAYVTDGRAAEVCDTVMAANRFVLTYRLPAS